MKKSLIILGSAFVFAATAVAQDECVTSKCGAKVLPESGDWSIAVDAGPFFEYVGNFFNNTSNNAAPTWGSWNDPYVIVGKYMADDQTAYRAIFAVEKYRSYETAKVTKAEALPLAPTYFGDSVNFVDDTRRHSSGGLVIGGGYEKRRGHGRLQGSYGGEILFAFQGSSNTEFTYGNALTQNPTGNQPNVNPDDLTYNTSFGGDNYVSFLNDPIDISNIDRARLLERNVGSTFGFGIRGFIGVEYFFVPKMSIGGEFGWGLGWMKQGMVSETWETEGYLADGSEAAATYTFEDEGGLKKEFQINNSASIDGNWANGNTLFNYIEPNGRIRLAFYF